MRSFCSAILAGGPVALLALVSACSSDSSDDPVGAGGGSAASGNAGGSAGTGGTGTGGTGTGGTGTGGTGTGGSGTGGAVNLPSWVANLAIGEWYEIPNTPVSGVDPSPKPPGNTGPASKVVAWTSFVVDPRTSKVYSVANGGHQDYSGNEVDVLELELEQPVWVELLAPTPTDQMTNGESYYADDRPAARHTYYGATFDELDDRIMLFGGAIWCDSGCGHAAISSYNIGANAYSPSTTHGTMTATFASTHGAFSADPATGDVYAFEDNFALGKWSRSTNTFEDLSPTDSPPAAYAASSAFDTTRNLVFVLGGGNGDTHHTYTLATNTIASVTLGGTPNLASKSMLGTVYVAPLDAYLVRGSDSGSTVWKIDAATFEVTTLATTGGESIPPTENGPYNKFSYVPRLGGVVYVPVYAGNAWFLRLH